MTDAAKRDYSWSLPNRRFIDSGLYLPSIRSEGIDTIAVIVDTSGSLPAATLAAFWTELREIASELQPERVILLQVDAAVQDAAEYAGADLPDEIAVIRSSPPVQRPPAPPGRPAGRRRGARRCRVPAPPRRAPAARPAGRRG